MNFKSPQKNFHNIWTWLHIYLFSCTIKTCKSFVVVSCTGDDWELCALEWGHWRMAAGESLTHFILRLSDLGAMKISNTAHVFAVLLEMCGLHRQQHEKTVPGVGQEGKRCKHPFRSTEAHMMHAAHVSFLSSVSLLWFSHLKWTCPMFIWPTLRRAWDSPWWN